MRLQHWIWAANNEQQKSGLCSEEEEGRSCGKCPQAWLGSQVQPPDSGIVLLPLSQERWVGCAAPPQGLPCRNGPGECDRDISWAGTNAGFPSALTSSSKEEGNVVSLTGNASLPVKCASLVCFRQAGDFYFSPLFFFFCEMRLRWQCRISAYSVLAFFALQWNPHGMVISSSALLLFLTLMTLVNL